METTEYQNPGSGIGGWKLNDSDREEVEVECGVAKALQRGFPDPYVVEPRARRESFTLKLSGYAEDVERMGEAYMRNYQPVANVRI